MSYGRGSPHRANLIGHTDEHESNQRFEVHSGFEYRLKGDQPALIRIVRADDKARLKAGFQQLSERSRLRRFFSNVKDLSEEQLRYFTEVDNVDHVAWGALDPEHPEAPGLGIARYIRTQEAPDSAEVAITVADQHQGQGVGTALFVVLNLSAAQNGIETFSFEVLQENEEFIRRLQKLGGVRTGRAQAIVSLTIPVRADAAEIPRDSEAGRTFYRVFEEIQTAACKQ